MEEGGLKRERIGEVGHLVLKKRSIILHSVSWGRQGLTRNLFSPMANDKATFTRQKEKRSPQVGNKRLGKGTPSYDLLPFSPKQQEDPGTEQPCRAPTEGLAPMLGPPRGRGCGPDKTSEATPRIRVLFPSRHPSHFHTIPRDLVAQVCVIPESCWAAGLDQSESQRQHTVRLPGRRVRS